jgi:diguanylate cyclase (GGDEF)-like protein
MPHTTPLVLHIIAPKADAAGLVRKAVAHAYPEALVTTSPDPQAAELKESGFLLIDTGALSEERLEHLLESSSEKPTILIVPDLTQVRRVSHHLSGCTTVVARSDLGGMGLLTAIHHLLERQKLQEQLKKASRHLKELSIRDELTHLVNHHHFDELLANEVRKANRYKRPLSLCILSIKNFTAINEAFGHEAGDRILVAAAEILRRAVREVDVPARYGDNEFAVILPESDEAAAGIVAARMHDALSAIALPGGGMISRLAVASGIAALSDRIEGKEQLLKASLGALISAKRNGAGSICTSDDAANRARPLSENRQLIDQLHERLAAIALESQQAYFRSLLKAMAEIPLMKKQLLPHSERVAFFSRRLAERAGLPAEHALLLHRAGILHDAGKLAIDAELVAKAGRLTEPEEMLMRQHPAFAVQIIGRTPLFDGELTAILHHHERFDGTGYPEGLAGEKIPIDARVLAIGEAWDAMISPQPYRAEPLSLDAALAELTEGAGTQFDPKLVQCFTGLIAS